MVEKNVSGSRRNFRKLLPGIHEVGPGAMRSAAKVVAIGSTPRGEEHEDHAGEVQEIRRRDEQAGEGGDAVRPDRSEEHTSELQSLAYLVCRLLLEKKKKKKKNHNK